MNLITTNIDTEEEENLYETTLYGIEARTNKRVLIENFGATRTHDEAT